MPDPVMYKDKAVIQAGWDDAPWIDAEMKREMWESTPVHLRQARATGVPTIGSGNVYASPLSDIVVDPFVVPHAWKRLYGIDVGWNMCLAKDTMVLLSCGTQKPIQDMQVGDEVLAFDFKTENLVPTKVVDTFKGYATNVVTVGVSKEQAITCTDDHPFAHRASPKDAIKFKEVRDIKDRIREFQSVVLPSKWDIQSEEKDVCSPEMARIIGYLLGDGCVTYTKSNRSLSFSQRTSSYVEDMRRCLETVGCKMRNHKHNYYISGYTPGTNTVLAYIRELGLLGKTSSTKFIPSVFFTASKKLIENLLVGLVHTDGSVEGDNVRYYTVSKDLAEGVKTLCLRLGIYTSVSKDYRKRRGTHKEVFRVTMRRPTCLPLLAPKELVTTKPERKKRADRLLSTYEPAPPQEIYCITVEHDDHAFVANGFVVSNTAIVYCAIDPQTDTFYIIDEYNKGNVEPIYHAEHIKRFEKKCGYRIPGAIDPAARGRSQVDGRKLIEMYQRDYGLLVVPAVNAVDTGTKVIDTGFTTGKIKVFKHCVNFQKEYVVYRRDLEGKIVKVKDHEMDGFRYAYVMRNIARAGPAPTIGTGYGGIRYF